MSQILNKDTYSSKNKKYHIAVVGDVHLRDSNNRPRARKDDYFLNTLNELNKIFESNDIILFLGDIFDTPILAGKSLYKFINLLKYYHKLDKKFYSIIGNHDIYAYNPDSLPKTSLGLLFAVGLIKNLKKIKVHDVLIEGMPFFKKATIVPKLDYSKESILLGHYFYNFNLDPDYSLTDDMIKEMNYDYLCLGHDHKPYPIQLIGKTKLLRGGSIARDSADLFNLSRKPCYYQFIISDKGISDCIYIEVPSLYGKDIFIDEVFEKTFVNEYDTITDVSDILKQFTKKVDVLNYKMVNALTDLNTPEEIFDFIKEKYQQNNIIFN